MRRSSDSASAHASSSAAKRISAWVVRCSDRSSAISALCRSSRKALALAIAGLGAFGFLATMAGTGYACWQASPYLSEIGSKFDVAPTQPPSAEEDEE